MKYLLVEVKICEGCGALWLRKAAGNHIYCSQCAARLADFPQLATNAKGPGGRPRRKPRVSSRKQGCATGRRRSGGAE